jgi:hypothetical protein
MTWSRFLLHDFWTAREFNRFDDDLRRRDRIQRRTARTQRQELATMAERVVQLEQDLGEATLLVRSLAELCIAKGVLSTAELSAKAEALDALDGKLDGRIGKAPQGNPDQD